MLKYFILDASQTRADISKVIELLLKIVKTKINAANICEKGFEALRTLTENKNSK